MFGENNSILQFLVGPCNDNMLKFLHLKFILFSVILEKLKQIGRIIWCDLTDAPSDLTDGAFDLTDFFWTLDFRREI